jgi:hypothetical protein
MKSKSKQISDDERVLLALGMIEVGKRLRAALRSGIKAV